MLNTDLYEGDARNLLPMIQAESVHLVCTSPPYHSLKPYPERDGQLGNIASYEHFLDELDKVWSECLRILVPGSRVVCVAGNICVSRRAAGRHYVLPLPADLQVRARRLGFDLVNPIDWHKISNIKLEASRSHRFLGKPNQPNGIIKNDIEHILFFRKPGGYRKPTDEMKRLSYISDDDSIKWFASAWRDVPGQRRRDHPAPYPLEVPRRLIQMFSLAGDTVVDPFAGTGTTALAALELGRHSISIEIEPAYVALSRQRLSAAVVPAEPQQPLGSLSGTWAGPSIVRPIIGRPTRQQALERT
jgi:site-specific DNA-methyltransferase (adenine-specific)